MTRFGIDAPVALRLAREGLTVSDGHRLVAPNRLLSDVLAALYDVARAGDLPRTDALGILDRAATMKIRLLGDRVSRATAFRLAWDLALDPAAAEYVAVAKLQADAFVTFDKELASRVSDLVPSASFDALFTP